MLLFFYFFILASPFTGTTVTPTVQAHACYCLCLHLTWSLSSYSACPASLHPQTSSEVFLFFPPSYLASPYLTATIPPFYKPFYPCLSRLLNLSCLSDVLNSNRVWNRSIFNSANISKPIHHSRSRFHPVNFPFHSCTIFLSQVTLDTRLHPFHHACTLLFTSLVHCALLWMVDPRYLNASNFI